MTCYRCSKESDITTRDEEYCSECYIDYINRKIRPYVTFFRVNAPGQPIPLIVIPVSFGACSLSLVDLLVKMRESQMAKHHGMYGFDIKCIHISDTIKHDDVTWPWPNVELEILNPITVNEVTSNKLSRSSEHDIKTILLRQRILAYVKEHNAYAAYGYSMTKISEITLAETVKGRGSAIPSLISPQLKEDHIVYPARDIMTDELVKYADLTKINSSIIADKKPPAVTKLQSIDEIVHNYFQEVQLTYPSVVSTVSKVANRLSQTAEPCKLCQSSSSSRNNNSSEFNENDLCYACRRLFI